jgi:glutamyl-Q tRNA(Asp) synthetase
LHFGSLVCALASYLDARIHNGQWQVRIEDIDPPREIPGASDAILCTLERHNLTWDGPVIWQSLRHRHYEDLLAHLQQQGHTYPCSCSRKRLESLGHRYDGHCRNHTPSQPAALRLKVEVNPQVQFIDRHLGLQQEDLSQQGDFIIHRKDGLFAYALAVVADDWQQGITHVVRGSDLLEATGKQIYLFNLLGAPAPRYAHIPVITNAQGLKLSKQNHAPALDETTSNQNIWRALWALGAQPPAQLQHANTTEVLAWGLEHWRLACLPAGASLAEADVPGIPI